MLGRLKNAVADAGRRSKRAIRKLRPLRIDAIDGCLNQLGVRDLFGLAVHSSLSSCGFVPGGSQTLIDQFVGRCGLLSLPTHTYCYPSTDGDAAIFDAGETRSVVGAVSDWFWRQDNVVRSVHSSHSLAACGANAEELCSGHETTDSPCGAGTPYEKLIDMSASVLMFGCTLNTYTLFHTTEALAECDYLYYPDPVTMRYVGRDEAQHSIKMRRQDMRVPRRFAEMEDELLAAGLLRRSALGSGTLLFIPNAADVHSYLMDRIRQFPRYLVAD